MSDLFNDILTSATLRCEGKKVIDDSYNKSFNLIYPFTTENISGYIDYFPINNKTILTVGSSLDQALNAIYRGAKSVSVLDINPYTKYYYYLKKSCILSLSNRDYLMFLRCFNYPNKFNYNNNYFNKETYARIKDTLSKEDNEALIFWDTLFNNFSAKEIRCALFSSDEHCNNVIRTSNLYLFNNSKYIELRDKLKNANVEFINEDIVNYNFDKTYNNIWLSNIYNYLSKEEYDIVVNKVINSMGDKTSVMLKYIYADSKRRLLKKDMVDHTTELRNIVNNNYNLEEITFKGVNAIENNSYSKDSIVLCKKIKH